MCIQALAALPAATKFMLAATAVTGGITAYGQHQQGKYQEDVAKNNAIVNQRMAQNALDRGRREEDAHRMKVAQFKSRQRAEFAAGGVDMQSGSALDILEDTAMMGELDALTIRSNAENEAYAYRAGAGNQIAQGRLSRMAGDYGAASTLLSTGGKVAGKWYGSK